MKTISVALATFALLLILANEHPAFADAGVFTGNGQNLRQITSETIQLVNIDVTITLGRGPFLFDGTVPGMDRAEYNCNFTLQNLSGNEEDVQVGFPVDSEFAHHAEPAENLSDWIFDYAFIARDDKVTYQVDFVRRQPQKGPSEFRSVFVWKMHFGPQEKKILRVQYRIPMSMGLVPTTKDERATGQGPEVFSMEFLNIAQLEMVGYVTSTGSSWAGNVESAKFTLITVPFEKYLTNRGITEEALADLNVEDAKRFRSSFPVLRPWWFRQVSPSGWKPTEQGLQWTYKDFKPKDPIEIRYYMTQIPRSSDEVDRFVDTFLNSLGPQDSRSIELGHLREIILATYGKEPQDEEAKAFAEAQVWYAPRKDFSMATLDQTQRSVLEKLDLRIAALKTIK